MNKYEEICENVKKFIDKNKYIEFDSLYNLVILHDNIMLRKEFKNMCLKMQEDGIIEFTKDSRNMEVIALKETVQNKIEIPSFSKLDDEYMERLTEKYEEKIINLVKEVEGLDAFQLSALDSDLTVLFKWGIENETHDFENLIYYISQKGKIKIDTTNVGRPTYYFVENDENIKNNNDISVDIDELNDTSIDLYCVKALCDKENFFVKMFENDEEIEKLKQNYKELINAYNAWGSSILGQTLHTNKPMSTKNAQILGTAFGGVTAGLVAREISKKENDTYKENENVFYERQAKTKVNKESVCKYYYNIKKIIYKKDIAREVWEDEIEKIIMEHGNKRTEKQGCYVATCVYGSYDCPEVWILRRYRDYYLKRKVLGKAFVKLYYKTSPTIVKLFGDNKSFKMLFKKYLNNKIEKLKEKGYKDTPYNDLSNISK